MPLISEETHLQTLEHVSVLEIYTSSHAQKFTHPWTSDVLLILKINTHSLQSTHFCTILYTATVHYNIDAEKIHRKL